MAFCPNCKGEFREGFIRCQECDRDLIEELPVELEKDQSLTIPVVIMNVADDIEAGIVISKLKANGIYAYSRHTSPGDYISVYMGSSRFGLDILVAKKNQETAIEILSEETQIIEEDFEYDESKSEEEGEETTSYLSRAGAMKLIVLAIIILLLSPLLISLVIELFYFLFTKQFPNIGIYTS